MPDIAYIYQIVYYYYYYYSLCIY